MTYTIEKGIPIARDTRGAKSKYPFASMDVSDSFFVPAEDGKAVRAGASKWGNKNKKVFRCISVDGGMRVWRVA